MLFILDNNCSPRLALGMNILEEGNDLSPYSGQIRHIQDYAPGDTGDTDVYILAAKKNAVVVTYDRDFKNVVKKAKSSNEDRAGVVYFRSYKHIKRYWDIVISFVCHWEHLKKMIAETEKPFLIEVTLQGLSKKEI